MQFTQRDKEHEVRFWLCTVLLLMGTNSHSEQPGKRPGIESLSWMVGSWRGSLGPQVVEETWSSPRAGSMEAMVRLSTPEGVHMIEFIAIREVRLEGGEDSLMLHLRQFSPELELRNSQDMRQEMAQGMVSFVADEGAAIQKLSYTRTAQDHIKAEVTMATGDVYTALLQPE
jgi:hypothetical protein